jgi:hypothetical protein
VYWWRKTRGVPLPQCLPSPMDGLSCPCVCFCCSLTSETALPTPPWRPPQFATDPPSGQRPRETSSHAPDQHLFCVSFCTFVLVKLLRQFLHFISRTLSHPLAKCLLLSGPSFFPFFSRELTSCTRSSMYGESAAEVAAAGALTSR